MFVRQTGQVAGWATKGAMKMGFASRAASSVVYEKGNDYYEVLGVKQSDDNKTIKKAYFKLAQEYHPDKYAGEKNDTAEEMFKTINNAYQVLKDDDLRKVYDTKKKDAMNPRRSASNESATGQSDGFNNQNTKSYDPFGSKSRKSNKNQNFYGDFKSQEDFYKHYSGFDTKNGQNESNTKSGRYYEKAQDFYRTQQQRAQHTDWNEKYSERQQNKEDFKRQSQQTNQYGDTKEEEEWFGGYTREEEEFYKKHFHGRTDKNQQEYTSRSASNPNDEFYDKDSMFNQFKHAKWKPKEEKVYQKYEAKKDSNFNQSNRGFHARPDMFAGNTFWAKANQAYYNPFKIRNYKTWDPFGQGFSNAFEQLFKSQQRESAKQTHESMNRANISNEDFMKMVPIKGVIFLFTFLFGTNKAICAFVK